MLAPLAQSLLTEPEVSVRLNAGKLSATEADNFTFCGAGLSPVPWCDYGYYLSERPKFTFDPRLHQGLYYVQDASSMAIYAALRQIAAGAVAYLDACAAPGGKTTAAIAALPQGSLVVANEYDFKRAEILAENLAKWGSPYAMATRGDTRKISKLKGIFDIIAVDAPCSGEGMMRKDAKAVEQWTPALTHDCADTQRRIIENVWPALKPGGYMIYSTCTFNRVENEENVQWIIDEFGAEPIEIGVLQDAPGVIGGIEADFPCYRFLPGRVRGEGLFMAVLRKPLDGAGRVLSGTKERKDKKARPELKTIAKWLDSGSEWQFNMSGDDVYAWPSAHAATMAQVCNTLDAHYPGLHVATIKGKDAIPAHELALSTCVADGAFAVVDVEYETAVSYLQRQSVTLPGDAPRGYVMLRYEGHNLGFVKNLGNRSNNLYPKNWRIRTDDAAINAK